MLVRPPSDIPTTQRASGASARTTIAMSSAFCDSGVAPSAHGAAESLWP